MKSVSNVIVLVAWAILVAACGGGGGGGAAAPPLDTTPPVITLLGNNPQVITTGTAYTELGATAMDNVDGDISGSIMIDSSSVDTSTVGSYSVTYDVTDSSGNAANTVIRTVTVQGAAPPPTQSPSGVWFGTSLSVAAADVFTSFEFNATGGFTIGTTPYTATYSNGNAETRGVPAFYISGVNAWHILVGTSATVTFETLPNTLSFWVRTETAGNISNIDIFDENGVLIRNVVPTNAYQMISVVRGAGQALIGSMVVTSTSGGDVVIDDLTFGYDGSGFVGSTDDLVCLVADNREFMCILSDVVGNLLASAQGTMQVANTNQVSGSGMLYAEPGLVLADGKTVANLTISGGTVSEGSTLNLTVEAAGTTSTVSTMFDPIYNRGSALATVAGVYDLIIFDDLSSFEIDATGAIFGQSIAGCVLSGEVTPKNPTFNEYDVALGVMDIGSCGVPDGMYVGLGLTLDFFVMDDLFIFAVFTTQSSVIGIALRP